MSEPGRLPFDPSRIKADPPASRKTSALITVSQLTRMVKGTLNREFPATLHVVGELSNVSQPAGGHIYFTLKDESSEVRCVMWRSDTVNMKFALADGMEGVASGTIDVYEPRGQYQFYVKRLEPRGVGALELAFRQLKERLEKEGLFDRARKRPLPLLPRRIAIVTSPTGAAIADMIQTIARRWCAVEIYHYCVRVQGSGAAAEIADAITRINHSHAALDIDVLIVGRGGGSLEDLWAFNEEIVARAIFASRIPVISAVGHEIDFTIADFVADIRAATPTAAAELVVPVMEEFIGYLDELGRRMTRASRATLDNATHRLSAVTQSPPFRDPLGPSRQLYQRLDEMTSRLRIATADQSIIQERRLASLAQRMTAASPSRKIDVSNLLLRQLDQRILHASQQDVTRRITALSELEKRLAATSHESILRRGFTITRDSRGKAVRHAKQVRTDQQVTTQTADGQFASRVIDANQPELFDKPPHT